MVSIAEHNKRDLWIASNSVVDGVRQFASVVKYRWNWRTTSSDYEMMTYGPSFVDYRIATVPVEETSNLKVADRIWVTEPQTTDILGRGADFEITAIIEGIQVSKVIFKKLLKDD